MDVATLGMLLCIFVLISMSPAQESPLNVALNKTATQSSTFNGTDTWATPHLTYRASAGLAVDGAPTKSYLDKTCALTDWLNAPSCTDNPWWQVDLGGLYAVFNVTIYQRGERETGTVNFGPLVVHIGDHVERPENRTTYKDRPLVSIPLSPPVTASTVNISILGCGILILCEVEVFAVRHVDKCASSPCQHGGTCADGLLNYACTCASGYTGVSCETDIDECGSSPCQRGAKCENLVGRFKCNCPPGYNGTRCETDINECASSPCQHGDCSDGVNSYSCTCLPGYTGLNCSQATTSAPVPAPSATSRASVECGGVVCDNGGVCKMTPGGSTCVCSPGYTGLSCHSKCQTGQYGLECSQTCPSCEDGYGCHYVHGACPPKAAPDRYAEGVGTGLGVGLGTSLLLALGIFALLRCRRRGNPSSEKASTNSFPMSSRQAVAVSRQQGTVSRGQEADPYESLDDATKDLGQSSPYSELEGARRGQEGASPYSYSSKYA